MGPGWLPVLLTALVLLLGWAVVPLLTRRGWTQRLPGTATAVWMCMVAGAVLSALGLLTLVLCNVSGLVHEFIDLLAGCPPHEHVLARAGVLASGTAAVLAVVCIWRSGIRMVQARTRRRHHQQMLHLVARDAPLLADVRLIEHPLPLAYSVGASRRPIVMSTGTIDALHGGELAAVLAHERAHLRRRHHLLLSLVNVLGAAMPIVPVLGAARREVPRLLELQADAAAEAQCGPASLMAALHRLHAWRCATCLGEPGEHMQERLRHTGRFTVSSGRALGPVRLALWVAALLCTFVPAAALGIILTHISPPC
jgi:Zn-dependent protease with chaperone function